MNILTRDDTDHGVDYVTLVDAQKEIERLQRERDEARALCPSGLWVSDADYQRLHTAATRLLTKINAVIPPGFFQQIEREYDALQNALYGRERK